MQLQELARILSAELHGDGSVEVTGVASLESASSVDVVFLQDAKFAGAARSSVAGAVLVGVSEGATELGRPVLVVKNPRLAFARTAAVLRRVSSRTGFVHPTAVVDSNSRLGKDVRIDAHVYIGPECNIGDGSVIGPGCVLLGNTNIGKNCELVARVTVYPKTNMGDRTVIHAGAVLGSDGFGFVPDETGRYEKFPQIGALEIGNDVEIGANTTVDRGALDRTVIADGVKLDNLVQIGHNVQIGQDVVVASQTGISGSSKIGRNAIVAGQVGIADHVEIGEGAILGAQCGVPTRKIIKGKGVLFWGTPARPIGQYLKELATLSRLVKKKRE